MVSLNNRTVVFIFDQHHLLMLAHLKDNVWDVVDHSFVTEWPK